MATWGASNTCGASPCLQQTNQQRLQRPKNSSVQELQQMVRPMAPHNNTKPPRPWTNTTAIQQQAEPRLASAMGINQHTYHTIHA